MSCETSPSFHALNLQNRRFPTGFHMKLAICYLVDVSRQFLTHLPHKMPRIPRKSHAVTASRWHDPAILKCCACHALNDDGGLQSATPATKNATHLFKTLQKYCDCQRKSGNDFRQVANMLECHACQAKQGYATFETSKSDLFCRTRKRQGHTTLTTGAHEQLRTVADTCEHKSSVEQTRLKPL